jgi:hypothetical protein
MTDTPRFPIGPKDGMWGTVVRLVRAEWLSCGPVNAFLPSTAQTHLCWIAGS